jgi:hypothetical protein
MEYGIRNLIGNVAIGIFLGVKLQPARKAGNLTAICEPIV